MKDDWIDIEEKVNRFYFIISLFVYNENLIDNIFYSLGCNHYSMDYFRKWDYEYTDYDFNGKMATIRRAATTLQNYRFDVVLYQ